MARIILDDVQHVLPALIRCALEDASAGDGEQRTEAERFLHRFWPTWRRSVRT